MRGPFFSTLFPMLTCAAGVYFGAHVVGQLNSARPPVLSPNDRAELTWQIKAVVENRAHTVCKVFRP